MTHRDSNLDLIRRLLGVAIEKIQYLDARMIPGWGIFFLSGIERLLPDNEREPFLVQVRQAIDARLSRGAWE